MTVDHLLRIAKSFDLGADREVKLPMRKSQLYCLEEFTAVIRTMNVEDDVIKNV